MLKGLFKVLEDSRAILIAAGVQPDGPFPEDEKIKDAYSHTVENSAFFGDVVLRFPKIVHHYFDRNSNWNNLIRWGIGFCNLSGIFDDGPHTQLLGLMSQELGISEKSPDYKNPFKMDNMEVRLYWFISFHLCKYYYAACWVPGYVSTYANFSLLSSKTS
ncbi:hypothetical protein XENTR_v10012445 [Xenopus tropicalis]|nr:hypothetical protein XENTR_v10012445 [Xenopus tropicalis]